MSVKMQPTWEIERELQTVKKDQALLEAKSIIYAAMTIYNLDACRKWLQNYAPEILEMEKK